jgi:hypothetical protein
MTIAETAHFVTEPDRTEQTARTVQRELRLSGVPAFLWTDVPESRSKVVAVFQPTGARVFRSRVVRACPVYRAVYMLHRPTVVQTAVLRTVCHLFHSVVSAQAVRRASL